MKKLVYSIALFGLVVLAACSGDSPGAKPVPTVVPDEWGIPTLTVSNPDPLVNSPVTFDAVIHKNGAFAPDGTQVDFSAPLGGGFYPGGATETTVETQDGHATVLFVATEPGQYAVRATIGNVSKNASVTYHEVGGDALEIYQPLIPNLGSPQGYELVVLRGKGIMAPVEVTFQIISDLPTVDLPAVVQEVHESSPLSAPGEIVILTPALPLAFSWETDWLVDWITVKRAVGVEGLEDEVILPAAFGYLGIPPEPGDIPVAYGLDPAFGQRLGGDQVTVFGRNLDVATRAVFTFRGSPLEAQILSASPDGLQMLISTPRFSAVALEQSEFADFYLDSPNGPSNTITQAFLVIADDPTPEIASLSPIAGPLGGGTLVSIFGSGFHVPVQVRFGNLTATDVNVIDDQTPADQDVITCLSPDYSQQGQVPPVTVDVTVTNMTSGRTSNARQFIYGDSLFISGNSPTEGWPGDQVVIYGAGFEDPLQVFFGPDELDVQSVSGTEILVRFPTDLAVSCSDRTGTFRVRLIESNQEATGGTFILRGNQPTVLDVEPTFVQADETGNYVSPSDITISGADFSDTLLVEINAFVMASSAVTVVDETTIEVTGIPAPNDFGLVFDTTPCLTDDGLQGLRKAPTPVNVSVVNLPGNCRDTLAGGLIYEPGDDTCVASATIEAPAPVFPAAQAGSCSTADLIVTNGGAGTLEVFQMNLIGRFYFDGGATTQSAPGFQVAPLSSAAPVPIYFCPDVDGGAVYNGQVAIQNNSPTNPFNVGLTANEAFPAWAVNATSFDFGDQTAGGGQVSHPTPLTITNTGGGTLNWTLTVSGADSANFWILEGATGSVPPNSVMDYTLIFNPTAVRGFSATLTISADQPDATPASVVITVTGNGV